MPNHLKTEIVSYPGGGIVLRPLRVDELAGLVARHHAALASAASLKPLSEGESPELLGLRALLMVSQYMDAVTEVVALSSNQPDAAAELRDLPPQILLSAVLAAARLTIEHLGISPTEIMAGKLASPDHIGKVH